MEMNIRSAISYPEGGITSKRIFSTGKSEATLFCMASGMNKSAVHSLKADENTSFILSLNS